MIFRRKLRYVLVEASGEIDVNDAYTAEKLKRGIQSFMGQLPYFKANPQISAQLDGRTFILSMNRGYDRNVVLALAFVKSLDGKKIGFYTLKTSGTIKSLKGRKDRRAKKA
jgi:RNase P/RNase MRP subunit POP5